MPGSDTRDRRLALARRLRRDAIRCTTAAGSGHPTSAMSAADLMAVLLATATSAIDCRATRSAGDNDHLIFSQGPRLAAALRHVTRRPARSTTRSCSRYRKLGSRLEGHPDAACCPGSTSPPARSARACRSASAWRSPASTSTSCPTASGCCCGDSEMAEGSVWEAVRQGAVLQARQPRRDPRRQPPRPARRRPSSAGTSTPTPRRRRAFGWHAHRDRRARPRRDRRRATTPRRPPTAGRPLIVAQTIKGKGVSEVEDKEGWHGKALATTRRRRRSPSWAASATCASQIGRRSPTADAVHAAHGRGALDAAARTSSATRSRRARPTATRWPRSARPRRDVVALDGEVSQLDLRRRVREGLPRPLLRDVTSPSSRWSPRRSACRCAAATPFASTFAAFLTRAYDFIRMAAISARRIRLCGSHAGVSIGEDGPSQMALEDLAMMRARLRQHGALPLRRQPDAPR